jgi:8-amino-7-oxononanoate synthase
MDDFLKEKLSKKAEKGQYRTLPDFTGELDFFSNDYLGFSRLNFDISSHHKGSTGSRLMSGNTTEALACEENLASFFEAEAALVFNSGYTANLGFWGTVPQRGDVILYDEHCHASIIDGIRLSLAERVKFAHNDFNELSQKLEKFKDKRCFVAVEGIYSMQGDFSELKSILHRSKEYGALVVVDEAHSAGVVGWQGRGFAHGLEELELVFARIVTFGKSFGFHGAAVLGSQVLKSYLINFCRPFIYTTALPPADYDQIKQRLNGVLIRQQQDLLHANIRLFTSKMTGHPSLKGAPNSPIQMIVGEERYLKNKAAQLMEHGIFTKVVFAPTVPEGQECIRICLHAFNTPEEIDELVSVLL